MRRKILSLLIVLTFIFGTMFSVQATSTVNGIKESSVNQNRILSKEEYIVNKNSQSNLKSSAGNVSALNASDSSILGYVDEVTGTTIRGWACDTSATDTPICVDIYIYDKISGNCVRGVEVEANEYRSDLAGYGYNHAFTYDWNDVPAGRYDINIYGIGETNSLLNNCPWTYISPSYQPQVSGFLDSVTGSTISGWAWDSVAPNNSIPVDIYILDRNTGSYVRTIEIQANEYRSDLENAGYGNGYHGFTYNWADVPPGSYIVYVHGMDGINNSLLTNSPWTYISKFGAALIGMNDADGADRSSWMSGTTPCITNMGYGPVTNDNYMSPESGLQKMRDSSIWAIHTHGSPTEVKFTENDGAVSTLTYDRISQLPNEALCKSKIVIYGTCNAAEGGESANNIVNITYQKGANCVIGFRDETKTICINRWLYEFFYASSQDRNISESCSQADYWTRVHCLGNMGGIDSRMIQGDSSEKLNS